VTEASARGRGRRGTGRDGGRPAERDIEREIPPRGRRGGDRADEGLRSRHRRSAAGGLPKGALEGLIRLRAAEIIFVSCDSPAFARDAAALIEAGYIPAEVDLVDLFPATYHAEIVAVFRKG